MCKCHGTRAITWPTLRTEVWVGGSCEMEGEDGAEGGLGPGKAATGKAQDRLPVVYVDLYVAKINLVVMWPRKTFSLRLFQAT